MCSTDITGMDDPVAGFDDILNILVNVPMGVRDYCNSALAAALVNV